MQFIMIDLEQIHNIAVETLSKIVLLVIDGLGGLRDPKTLKTELETARIPNLDKLASDSICGMTIPVSSGITVGSTPGHLALFGYDPVKHAVGRGIVEALGIDIELKSNDIAARGNFCTVDENGIIMDRRAGRIDTEKNIELCHMLNEIDIPGIELKVHSVKEHRFVIILRGKGLIADLSDSDPQQIGLPAHEIKPLSVKAWATAKIANEFVAQAKEKLRNEKKANMVLMRGFSKNPNFPTIHEVYRLTPCAIAVYPMYRGLAHMLGMHVPPTVSSISEQVKELEEVFSDFDFFFIHNKNTDSRGEDGNFEAKVKALEEVDAVIPRIMKLKPDVLIVAGDHSTPAILAMHSWHSVPFLLHSKWCRVDTVTEFSEEACSMGGLGRFPAVDVMPLAMANALKLTKFGA